jgi:hypothetical protein
MSLDLNIIISSEHVRPQDSLDLFSTWAEFRSGKIEQGIHILPAEIQPRASKTFIQPLTMAHLLAYFEIFPSVGQAKKNGWDRPIPNGWSEWKIGKLNHKLWIWNPAY